MRIFLILAGLFVVGFGIAKAEPAGSSASTMKCETGPVPRTFGGTRWVVYSCDDLASMVVISAQGNPASPFYFFLKPKPDAGNYTITGEGNGDKKASDAAGDALSKMTPADLAALLAATKATAPKS